VGFLPQRPSFLDNITVTEALTYAAWLHRIPRSARKEAVERTLEDLNLEAFATVKLHTLSGGTRQRAHIGQTIVHQPSVLLVDEPTVGLDAEQRLDLRRLLRRLAANRLVVMSTHLTEDIELLADRVIAFSSGRLVFDGTPSQLAQLGVDHALDLDARGIELGLRLLVHA
jgi:ABC-2 type transport system ATP-binding protein